MHHSFAKRKLYVFPPDHLIDDSHVALDDLHHLGADVLLHVIRHRDTVVAVLVHRHGRVHGLQQRLLVDAGDEEASLVEGLGALGGGADADGRERMPHRGEETALLRQGTGIRHHRKGVHLQTIVVMEA